MPGYLVTRAMVKYETRWAVSVSVGLGIRRIDFKSQIS